MKTGAKIRHLYKKHKTNAVIVIFGTVFMFFLFLIFISTTLRGSKAPFNSNFLNENISSFSKAEVKTVVNAKLADLERKTVTLKYSTFSTEISLQDLGVTFNEPDTIDAIFSNNYNGQFFFLNKITKQKNFSPVYAVNINKIETVLHNNFGKFESLPTDARFNLNGKSFTTLPSSDGLQIDHNKFASDISNVISGDAQEIIIDLVSIEPTISLQDSTLESRVEELANTQGKLVWGQDVWILSGSKLLEFLTFLPEGQTRGEFLNIEPGLKVLNAGVEDVGAKNVDIALDKQEFDGYLKSIQSVIDKPARDATLRFENGKVVQYTSAQNGQELNLDSTWKKVSEKLREPNETGGHTFTVDLDVKVTKAKIASEEINSLGIKELIGSGISYFAGSIPNRVFNIELGSRLINGTLISPGEIFSFVKLVGDVSAEQGFKSAYVIKSGRTVLDDGGGICQVSTTVFRAALNSGLPIVKRTAHAYRVSYYEQKGFKAGLDATIFSPTVDFQFKNDTSHYILVQTIVDKVNSRLQVDIYGTSDGRRVELTEPVISNIKPAPEPKYEDDPSLPKGTTKQVDYAAAGATSVFSRKVYKGDELIINESFKSVFRPWQAVFLVGTAG